MSYPPNSPAVTRRSPQHGIRVVGDSTTKFCSPGSLLSPAPYTSPSSYSWSSIPVKARTSICAEALCDNKIDVVPHGFDTGHADTDRTVYIKARCKECEPPVMVPTWWEGHAKASEEEQKWEEASSVDWADEF